MSKVSRRDFLRTAAGFTGAALLAACQPAPTPAPTQAPAAATKVPAATTAPATQAPAAKPVAGKITGLFHGAGGDPNTHVYWKIRLEQFRKAFPDVELIALGALNDQEFTQKMTTMVAGGTPPDFSKISGGRLLATYDKGIYEDLAVRVNASPDMKRIFAQLPDEGKELRICGKQYALPMDIEHRLWFYNKDLFDKEGVPYPSIDWTWEDLLKIGEKVTKPADNQYLVIPGIVSFQDYADWVWQAGGRMFSENCMNVNLSEAPNIKGMEMLVDLFVKYKYAPSPSLKLGEIGVGFDTGKVALNMMHTNGISAQLGDKATWKFKWSAVFAPKGPVNANGFTKSNGFSLLKGAKGAEIGWKLIEWWLSDKTQTMFAEEGEIVVRNDIRTTISVKKLPDHLGPALAKAAKESRGLERCQGWDICQKHWREQLETSITGGVPVKQAMETADKKAEVELAELMASACK